MLNRSGENEHPRFVPDLRTVQVFTIEWDVICVCVINGFYYVEVCFSYTSFVKSFYHEWVLNFIKSFFCVYWDDYMIFIFCFVNMVQHVDWFAWTNPCLDLWNKFHLIMQYNFFKKMFCWIPFANILLRIFASMFIKDIGL